MRLEIKVCIHALCCGSLLTACTSDPAASPIDASASSGDPNETSVLTTTSTPATDTSTIPPATATGTTDDGGTTEATPIYFDLGGVPDAPIIPEPIPDFDCNLVPDGFVSYQLIAGPRGYHGLEIAENGLMIGSDGSSLIDSTYGGDWGLFIPGIGAGQQMDWLSDGDLVHATSDGAITRIRLDATTEVIRSSVGAYGVVVGPDNQIYVTIGNGGNVVQRISPLTGDLETIVNSPGPTLHSVGFSTSGQRMYIGTINGGGTVYYVDLDLSMNPIGAPQVFTTDATLDGGNWHDAIAVDACDYVYVTDYSSRNIWRISPGGDGILFWDPADQGHYAHGFVWGTGNDGWIRDALYFPQPYNSNSVGEVVVGVPPAGFGGTVSNAPAPL